MSWAPILQMMHFLAAVIYIYLAARIFRADSGATLNRAAVALLLCFFMWSGGMTFMSIPGMPPGFIGILWRIYPLGWITFPVFVFLLFLLMSDQDRILRSPFLKPALFILPVFFFILHSNKLLMHDPVLGDYGWYPVWNKNIWATFYYIYYIFLTLIGIILMFRHLLKVKSRVLKRMSVVILAGSTLTLSLGSFLEIMLNRFTIGQTFFSQVSDIVVLIWAFSIMYAVTSYGFFKITPLSAAENIIANMRDMLLLLNEEMTVEYANTPILDYLGYGERELNGKPLAAVAGSRAEFNIMLKTLIINGSCRVEEFHLKKKDGSSTPVVFSASLLKEIGDIIGVVCVATDISEIKKAHDAMQESYDRLKELDSLKSNFTSMVSHELRTPLTSIKGFLHFLLGGVGGTVSPQQREYLEIVMNNSERLLALINDLLDVSKMESGNFTINKEPAAMGPLIDRCVKDVNPLSDARQIKILAECGAPGTVLNIDHYRISQAVINLLSNAIKFSPRGSKITVSFAVVPLSSIHAPAYINITRLPAGSCAVLSVRDNGAGIEKNELVKIFDRFYQVENTSTRKAPGTGLGLNIVKNIVEMHDGVVWAESGGPGKGAVFTIVLPADIKEKGRA